MTEPQCTGVVFEPQEQDFYNKILKMADRKGIGIGEMMKLLAKEGLKKSKRN